MPCRSRWTGIGKLLRQRYQLWDPNECASPQDHLIRTMRANDKVWVTWPYRITFLWKKYTVLDTFFKGKLSWYTHGGFHCWHFFSPENASFLAVMLTTCHRPLPCSQITISYCADFPDRHWLFEVSDSQSTKARNGHVPFFFWKVNNLYIWLCTSVHLSFCIIYTRYFEVFLANC